MTLTACLEDQIGRLVHPTAHASPDEAARHRIFVETRLAVTFGALAFVPFYLAGGGVPGSVEALILAWLVLPLLAVALVSSKGQLRRGELISHGAWTGLAATLVLGHVTSPAAGVAILLLLPLEAGLAGNSRALRAAAGIALGGTLALLLVPGGPVSRPADLLFPMLAVSYGAMLCIRGTELQRVRLDAERLENRQQKLMIEAFTDLAIRFDGSGATPINEHAARKLFGIDPSSLMGRGFFDRVHVADRPAFLRLLSEANHGTTEVGGRIRLRIGTQAGRDAEYEEPVFTTIEMRVRNVPSQDNGGSVALAFVRDAAASIHHEAAAVRAAHEAAEEGTWRDRFLATVSHELRTPLNAIIGFSEILASDKHAPQQADKRQEYAEIVHASGLHLLAVVNSMLDLSKMDAGKFDLVLESFDVADLLGSCCDMMRLKAERARIDLEQSVDPAALHMVGDKQACRQIVLNLLSNALKFTPEYGRVWLEARAEGDVLSIAVVDTGIGILAPDMARLGDPFFQAQNAYDRRFEGTGLGLSVVSGLVGLHGGTITAESAPGEGTRITVRLPSGGRASERQSSKARIETISRPPRSATGPTPHPAKVKKIA